MGFASGGISEAFLDCGLNIKCRDTTTNTLGQREDSVFFILQVLRVGGFSALTETHLVLTRRFGGGFSFLQPICLGMCFTGGPAAGQTLGCAQHVGTHISAAESSVTYYELLVANLGGSSFFLTLLFPGLLSHHNQKPAESIMRDRQRELGSGLLVSLSMWALG